MLILALDLGKFNTMCCFFDTDSRKYHFLNAVTDRNCLEMVSKRHSINLLVMEACGPTGWIHDLAVSLGLKTLVCSTNEDAWKWSNVKRKTDRDDALKLARMAAMNELKPVHMPSPEHREFRSLVKYRKTLDYRITKIKCTIRAWFVNHGIGIERGEAAWYTGRQQINEFRKPLAECSLDELWKGELDLELTQLDALQTMKPKENSDQRKKRLRKESREAREAQSAPSRESPKSQAAASAETPDSSIRADKRNNPLVRTAKPNKLKSTTGVGSAKIPLGEKKQETSDQRGKRQEKRNSTKSAKQTPRRTQTTKATTRKSRVTPRGARQPVTLAETCSTPR